MKRRDFITLIGAAAATPSLLWPLAAHAQQPERMRRIGVLLGLRESDPEAQSRIAVFRQELQKLGWTVGRNLRMDTRFGADDVKQIRTYAAELVGLAPDVIFINSQPVFDVMREATRTIPIVFVQVTDPVGRGLVASLARPGGNLTGLSNYESMGGKWLEMLKEIAPNVATAVVILTPESASNAASFRTIEDSAPSLGVQLITAGVRNATDIERAIDAFAQRPNGGLIILASPTINSNRDMIIALAARHRLPAVYPYRYFVTSGGLVSYGVDNRDLSRGAASYVDRILKGEKPGDLPIQQPTKLEFVLNLKTAKALGLTIPDSFLLRADEVIE